MPSVIDERGNRYGKLVVIRREFQNKGKKAARWLCMCDCGCDLVARGDLLREGKIKSCGCLHKESLTKHGLSKTPLYKCWQQMLQRCFNPKRKAYVNYGGRGITVCDRWNPQAGGSFENFVEDMGMNPEKLTLDRIDVHGNYCKENCRWSDWTTQANNRRSPKTNTSGRVGVFRIKRRQGYHWKATITRNGEYRNLGTFKTFEEACEAREIAEREYEELQNGK